jgi:hypothetical protein
VVFAATVVAVVYVLWAHALNVLPVGSAVTSHGLLHAAETAFGHVPDWMYDFTGSFGWALANPPLAAVALLAFALCAVVLTGLVTGERHQVVVLATLIVTALLLPIAIVASQAHKNGIVWQARDGFPLYCGVILVAGIIARVPGTAAVDSTRTRTNRVVHRLAIIVAGCVAFAQFGDLMWALRSYEDGLIGSLNLFGHFHGAFSPPLPAALIVLAAGALCAAYGWWIVRVFTRMSSRRDVLAPLGPQSEPRSPDSEEVRDLVHENGLSPTEMVLGGGP